MIITASNLTHGNGVNASSAVTASISPKKNRLILLSVSHQDTAVTPSVSGCSLTFEEVRSVTVGDIKHTVFRAMGNATSGALTISFGGSVDRYAYNVDEFDDNVDKTGTNGSAAIVQSNSNTGTGTSISVTLSAFSNINNATYGSTALQGQNTTTHDITAGSGFTELGDDYSDPGEFNTNNQTQYKSSNDTTVDSSWSGSNQASIIGIEIKFGQQFKGAMI